jgi:hypothetical protein
MKPLNNIQNLGSDSKQTENPNTPITVNKVNSKKHRSTSGGPGQDQN